ncbi:MurR/RpiR family transcriptional regulator [Rhodovulum euryhalinum]|uniref:RpiR family transcriptional regulator n=1 Tax=Rhodovulum euryhalinum TaxID=35805 RepID=A0A4R2KSH2_9RHOB|nr:MurR/RpiR family transcriptional regulator [Rhodovulum euryhalinum]TCO73966.1 RpiR family transcriptional regulator [Rhodovulum euryhalinum]
MPEIEAPGTSLVQRIHAVYDALPAGERRAADIVLDRPGELALWSASELAAQAVVSNATVSRFVRRLGYASYDAARREARAMRRAGSPLELARRVATGPDSDDPAAVLAADTQLLQAAHGLLDQTMTAEIAARMAHAPRVRLAGFRNSYIAAEYGRTMLAQLRPDVEMLNAPGQTLAEGIAGVGPGDMVLIVGLRRRPAGFRRFVRAVAGTGADVALLADPGIRETPAEARWTLTCPVEAAQVLDSYVGVLSVLRVLALAVMQQLGPAAHDHLSRIETLHDALDEIGR